MLSPLTLAIRLVFVYVWTYAYDISNPRYEKALDIKNCAPVPSEFVYVGK